MLKQFIETNNYHRIEDEILATAYENMGDYYRSFIKTAIAFHFANYKQPRFGETFYESSQNGFETFCITQKIKNILFYVDTTYDCPAKFLALLCQAIIAQAENIFVFLDKNIKEQTQKTLLTCLELAGIENSFFAPQNFYTSIENLATNETKIIYCTKQNIFSLNPHIFIDNITISIIAPLVYTQEIELAYSKENILYKDEPAYTNIKKQRHQKQTTKTDVSFCVTDEALQNYTHGMEFCFLYPNLTPLFFINKIQYQALNLNFE